MIFNEEGSGLRGKFCLLRWTPSNFFEYICCALEKGEADTTFPGYGNFDEARQCTEFRNVPKNGDMPNIGEYLTFGMY